MNELGVMKIGPASIYEDNAAYLLMKNAGENTERFQHIDIK